MAPSSASTITRTGSPVRLATAGTHPATHGFWLDLGDSWLLIHLAPSRHREHTALLAEIAYGRPPRLAVTGTPTTLDHPTLGPQPGVLATALVLTAPANAPAPRPVTLPRIAQLAHGTTARAATPPAAPSAPSMTPSEPDRARRQDGPPPPADPGPPVADEERVINVADYAPDDTVAAPSPPPAAAPRAAAPRVPRLDRHGQPFPARTKAEWAAWRRKNAQTGGTK